MDQHEDHSAEAQTIKVAETNPGNGMDTSTDTPTADAQGGTSTMSTMNMEKADVKAEDMLSLPTKEAPNTTKQTSPSTTSFPSPEQSKRRASRSSSPNTKRRRTSQSPATSRRESRDEMRSRPPARAKPDDKARNRRLFGGMLSTIAAKPNQRAARPPRPSDNSKREELERRAAERERARLKEEEDARREREFRKREENSERYVQYERETILAKADNQRIRAEFLETKARPALFYKPYILTKEQKDTLNQQIDDADVQIQEDIRKYEETHPDQPPLPWKPLAQTPSSPITDIVQQSASKMDDAEVSNPSLGNDVAMKDEPMSKMDGAEWSPEQKKNKPKTDDFDEDVIETSEGGVSLIY